MPFRKLDNDSAMYNQNKPIIWFQSFIKLTNIHALQPFSRLLVIRHRIDESGITVEGAVSVI